MSGQKPDRHRGEETFSGLVKDLNFAPKGEIDGILLDVDGQTVQVNIPPDRAAEAAALVGRHVELTVGPEPKAAEHPEGAHPVRRLVAFRGEHGPDLGPGGRGHGPGEPAEVRGTVARLNYAKHGEANGVVLDSGDFVHLKPGGMRRAGLRVGQEVTARGKATPSRAGARAIEAEVVNGLPLGPKTPRG